jgi:hypothetical protein
MSNTFFSNILCQLQEISILRFLRWGEGKVMILIINSLSKAILSSNYLSHLHFHVVNFQLSHNDAPGYCKRGGEFDFVKLDTSFELENDVMPMLSACSRLLTILCYSLQLKLLMKI